MLACSKSSEWRDSKLALGRVCGTHLDAECSEGVMVPVLLSKDLVEESSFHTGTSELVDRNLGGIVAVDLWCGPKMADKVLEPTIKWLWAVPDIRMVSRK